MIPLRINTSPQARSRLTIMDKREVWTVRCEDPNDYSGDIIVNLPNELLNQMGLVIGDQLLITVVNGSIELRPVAE
jgi:hypothetical protein